MYKSLPGYLLALVFVGPLAVALVPLFYGLLIMMAFALPLALVLSAIEDVKDGSITVRSEEFRLKFVYAFVLIPIGLVAIAAPLRAVLAATLSFFPEQMGKFNYIHAFIFNFFEPAFGDLSAYWVDLSWGILGVAVIFLLALGDSIRRNRLVRQIEVLPTSKVRSVAMGLVELKGKAVPLRGKSSSRPIIREWRESTGDGSSRHRHFEPFYLDDGTGRILVDAKGAFIKTERQFFDVGMHQAILTEFDAGKAFPETRLMPGDTVYVLGNVQANRDKKLAKYGDTIVKPKKSSLTSMKFYDLFFISNVSEEALLEGFGNSVQRGWRNITVILVLAAWLSVFSLTNILQLQALDLRAAPDYLRLISTPTTLERVIKIPRIGKDATIRFVEMLKEGDVETSDTIMEKFQELRLTDIALPTLRAQAKKIDNPAFGIGNRWLASLEKMPRNEWGTEFLDRGIRYLNESRVLRLMTRYRDNRLFVSYRASIDGTMVTRLHRIKKRTIVIEVVSRESGKTYTAEFATDPGTNAADDVQAFEFLYPGVYDLQVYVKSIFVGGAFRQHAQSRSPMAIHLDD